MQRARHLAALVVPRTQEFLGKTAEFFFHSRLLGNVLHDADRPFGLPVSPRGLDGPDRVNPDGTVGRSIAHCELKRFALFDCASHDSESPIAILGMYLLPESITVPVRFRRKAVHVQQMAG